MGRRNRTRSERRKRNAERRRTAMRWTLDARRYATVTLRAVAAAMCVAVLVAWWAVDRVGPDGAVLGWHGGRPWSRFVGWVVAPDRLVPTAAVLMAVPVVLALIGWRTTRRTFEASRFTAAAVIVATAAVPHVVGVYLATALAGGDSRWTTAAQLWPPVGAVFVATYVLVRAEERLKPAPPLPRPRV